MNDQETLDLIMLLVEEEFGVKPHDLKRRTNLPKIVRARQVAMYLVRCYTWFSYPEIGRIFGHKHHTTVMYAVRKIAATLPADVGVVGQIKAGRVVML